MGVALLLLLHCDSAGPEGGEDEGDDDGGVVLDDGTGVLGLEGVLVGEFGEVGAGGVVGVGEVGRDGAVSDVAFVEIVETYAQAVVVVPDALHFKLLYANNPHTQLQTRRRVSSSSIPLVFVGCPF